MKQRTLAILSAAAILSVGTALVLTPSSGVEAPPGAGKLAFEDLASRLQGATRIEIDKRDGRLVLERKGDTWVAADRGGYPVRPERVRELLVGLTEVRLLEPRTADPAMHERLGVEDPSKPGSTGLHVRVQEANGAPLAELVVGRRRVRTQGNLPESAYIRRPGEAQSWLGEGRLPVDADPQLWLDRDVVNLPATRVREVAVRRTDEPELALARVGEPSEGGAKLTLSVPAGFQAADESAVDEVGGALEFVTFLDVKAEGDTLGEAVGESRFTLADGLAVIVAGFRDGDKLWLRLRAEGDGSAAQTEAERLNARWRGWAYQVAAWKEKAVLPHLSDLGGRSSTSNATPAPATPSNTTSEPSPASAAMTPTAPASSQSTAPSAATQTAPVVPTALPSGQAAASLGAPAAENGVTPFPSSPAANRSDAPAATAPNTPSGQSAATPGTTPSGAPATAATPDEQTATTAPHAPATPSAVLPSGQAAASSTAVTAPVGVTLSPSAPGATAPTPSVGPATTDTALPAPLPAPQTTPPPLLPATTAQTAKPERPERPERTSNRNRGSASRDHPQQSSATQPR